MRLIFMGTPAFALPSLERLAQSSHTICAVVTGLDQPAGRGLQIQVPPVKRRALELGLLVLQPQSLKTAEFAAQLRAYEPDLFVVVAFRILPAHLLTIPRWGAINLHASLLPKYRGAAPINWAIINGDQESGVTIFRLKPTVDTGNILSQRSILINAEDTAATLAERLATLGADLLVETIAMIAAGTVQEKPQDDELATPAPKIFPELGEIDWYKDAFTIKCLIHGLSPEPGAFTFWQGKRLKILRASWQPAAPSAEPGTIVACDKKRLVIQTGDGWLLPQELQLEGRKALPVAAFLPGFSGTRGDRFGA
jgi:methionyl-tRNA formyltransferase